MKRRIITLATAAALALAALLGGAPAATAEGHLGETYVALGDSEAAGTGNLPYLDLDCLRSARAYPEILGAGFGGAASSACAGATTDHVLYGQLGDLGEATQLVTLTVGINNADWQAVLAACSSLGTPVSCQTAYGEAALALADLPQRIGQLVGAIRTYAPNAYIAVTGYPLLFGDVTGTCSVGAFQRTPVKVSAQQAMLANTGVTNVNAAIAGGVQGYQLATSDPGVGYVDVTAAFDGHGLCDTGDRWISGLVSGQATFDRSFHPNAAGQQAYAGVIAAALPW
jgi:lysophospholipase L1-like esterase